MVKMVKAKVNMKKLGMTDYQKRDVERIRKVFKERGYKVSKLVAYFSWKEESESVAASWLDMDGYSDDELFQTIGRQLIDENGKTLVEIPLNLDDFAGVKQARELLKDLKTNLSDAVLENRQEERF